MKIRNSFVSNSSTTSFCICGIVGDEQQIKELFDIKCVYDIDRNDVAVYQHYDWGTVYVGVSVHSMKDDETKAQFKERARKILQELANKEIPSEKIGFHTDGWYEG